jgi:large subunit ribosomal protein L3
MSRVFTDDGRSIPVTLIEATPNRVAQVKTVETDGYSAVQVTVGARRAALVNKPEAGHFAKAKVKRVAACGSSASKTPARRSPIGGEVKADIFEVGQKVDVPASARARASRAPSSATTSHG